MTDKRPFDLREALADMLGPLMDDLPDPDPDAKPINVVKYTSYLTVSDEDAMDMGLIPDTRPPAPKPSWRRRFLWWRQEKTSRFRMWLGSRIAGVDLNDREDW